MNQFIVKISSNSYWVTGVINGTQQVLMSHIRQDARIFGPDFLAYWQDKEGYEIVELPEDERLSRLGENVAPRLPGF